MYTMAKMQVAATKPILAMVQKPTPVCYIGAGKVKEVANILSSEKIKKVLVMTDGVLFELGLLDSMLESFKEKNIEAVIFNEVKPDPTFSITEKALDICLKNKCEAVIAFGGGSVLDSAKAVVASATNNCSPRKLEGLLKVKKEALTFIAIPTTAGTGSEVTLAAVISDDDTHKKTTIVSPKLIPKVAILDPELTVGLPAHITSSTAMDALTHALEAYTNTYATEESDKYALKAINLICNNIETAFNTPNDLAAREALLVGSFYAGMAFTRTYVGYVHAFSHNIGGAYGVPHGLGNAVILPHVMKTFRDVCKDRFAYLADFLEISETASTDDAKADLFIEYLFELNKKLQLPERLEKFPKEGIEKVLEAGLKECHGTYPVPLYYTKEQAREILKKVSR